MQILWAIRCAFVENKCRNCGVFFFVLFELCKRVCDFSAVGSANENQSFSSVTQPEQHQQGEHAIIILCACVCVCDGAACACLCICLGLCAEKATQ